ncbi:transcriptional regulator with XRE-family HTH domain [Anoxybacillus calidus]|uniref:Transcriptional regulator with XRE-family HTH domain n=1 Tax=[Anoxybacillus] calidus TaxID=575178 RepID=A0A7W0BVI7_9BACL|nr:helix-turn-helix transcriptional regulator [Anoxybacillus calidus]MBA2872436.1 transcriptional regulator with XRE-family HTH domain [Anoxybacillus calidus]
MQYTADQLGIAKSTYAGYESGYRQPSLDALKELAVLFETSVDYLLGMTETYTGERHTIELTSKDIGSQICLTIDGKSLSQDELNQFIAFIRLKREMEAK